MSTYVPMVTHVEGRQMTTYLWSQGRQLSTYVPMVTGEADEYMLAFTISCPLAEL